ncbi:MAG: flagellar hook-length control protein FliK [Aquabacterium sp.]
MSTPIKSSNTGSAAGMPAALNELMNKLNAQTQNAMGSATENPEQAFARWLEKHAIGAEAARRPEDASQTATATKSNALQNNVAASRAAEQALARARQLSAAAKPAEHAAEPNTRAEAKPAKARNDQNNANKTTRKEASAKPASGDHAEQTEETNQSGDEVNFSTAMGDGAAVVRELTPPPTIQAGDPAAMMAWLASLTNGDAQGQTLQTGELNTGEQAATDAKDPADAALLDGNARGKGHGRGGMTLDLQAWQGVSGKAEKNLEQLGAGGRPEADALSSLMSAGAGKAGGFGQVMNEATRGLRHESATLNTPFGSPEFPQALAEKVSMWVNTARDDGPMTAELHLNPAEMGPINVKISLDGQSAHVDFAAAALETRQAIESSLSMLSSALNDVGLSLTGGGVSSQTSQQAFEQQAGRDAGTGRMPASGGRSEGAQDDNEPLSVRQVAAPRPGRAGGLDLYA